MDALEKFFRRHRRRRRRRPPGFGKWAVITFYYEIGASGVRGSIRLVFRVPKVILFVFKYCTKNSNSNKKNPNKKYIKNDKNMHSIKNPYRNIPHSYPLKGAVM